MAATGAPTILDSWYSRGQDKLGGYKQYLVTFAGGSAATDYATGGQTFTMPADAKGEQFVSLQVLYVTPINARRWNWNGDQATPLVLAFDAFVTEEGAGTTVNSDTITAILTTKQ